MGVRCVGVRGWVCGWVRRKLVSCSGEGVPVGGGRRLGLCVGGSVSRYGLAQVRGGFCVGMLWWGWVGWGRIGVALGRVAGGLQLAACVFREGLPSSERVEGGVGCWPAGGVVAGVE